MKTVEVPGLEPLDWEPTFPHIANLVVRDKDGWEVLLVDAKGHKAGPPSVLGLVSYLANAFPPIPFGMLVDSETIQVFRQGDDPAVPVLTLETFAVLGARRYHPGGRPVPAYMLYWDLERWLDDLIQLRGSDLPPAYQALAEIGLMGLIQGGAIKNEAELRGHPVR